MTHEEAIDAALNVFWPGMADLIGRVDIASAIAAYLEARGAVLVPREPTPNMIGAWYRYKSGHHFQDEPTPRDTSDYGAYRAMLAALSDIPKGDGNAL